MPVWFIVPGFQVANVASEAAWQVSHGWFSTSGMCGVGAEDVPFAWVPSWHWTQFEMIPRWFIGLFGPNATVLLWQVSHGWMAGIWLG